MGISAPNKSAVVFASTMLESTTVGIMDSGMSRSPRSSSSHAWRWMSNNIVLDALLASVA